MQTNLFLKNKIKRQIKINGAELTFSRYKIDKYHQATDEVEEEYVIKGLYHTSNNYIKENISEASKIVTKQQPMFLVLFEDGEKIKISDTVLISGVKYNVANKNDVSGMGIAYDISLEEILNG